MSWDVKSGMNTLPSGPKQPEAGGPNPPEAITAAPLRRVRRPVMLQGWYNLTSLHWSYDADTVAALLPRGFRVDTFDGRAWVGLIPFHMRRIRIPGLEWIRLPWSTFPETNVRTYIVDSRGRRGVWFFSLDITRIVPTIVARTTYSLPYCSADMTIDEPESGTVRYTSSRRWPRATAGAGSDVVVASGDVVEPDAPDRPLIECLSARWALGSTFAGQLLWADVDHPVWPLHRVSLVSWNESLVAATGLPAPVGEPVALWSPGVEVRIGRPHRVRRGTA